MGGQMGLKLVAGPCPVGRSGTSVQASHVGALATATSSGACTDAARPPSRPPPAAHGPPLASPAFLEKRDQRLATSGSQRAARYERRRAAASGSLRARDERRRLAWRSLDRNRDGPAGQVGGHGCASSSWAPASRVSAGGAARPCRMGLGPGLLIGDVAEYRTFCSYRPVRERTPVVISLINKTRLAGTRSSACRPALSLWCSRRLCLRLPAGGTARAPSGWAPGPACS